MEIKYTPNGLPVVTIEVIQESTRDLLNGRSAEPIEELALRLKDENPIVYELFNALSRDTESEKARLAGMVRMYYLLDRQAELNRTLKC